jgi:hypothetical protein
MYGNERQQQQIITSTIKHFIPQAS